MKRVFDWDKLEVKKSNKTLNKIISLVIISILLVVFVQFRVIKTMVKVSEKNGKVTNEITKSSIEIGRLLRKLELEHTAPLELRDSVSEIYTKFRKSNINFKDKKVDYSYFRAYGSGTVIDVNKEDKEFLVLTAKHVIYNRGNKTENIEMVVNGKTYKNITVLKKGLISDLAVLLVKGETSVKAVPIAVGNPEVGSTIWLISNPLKLSKIINKSIVGKYENNQMITPIGAVSGASGGMIVDLNHNIVGVISSMALVPLTIDKRTPIRINHPTIYSIIVPASSINKFLKGVL